MKKLISMIALAAFCCSGAMAQSMQTDTTKKMKSHKTMKSKKMKMKKDTMMTSPR